jgi:hypothetical protein
VIPLSPALRSFILAASVACATAAVAQDGFVRKSAQRTTFTDAEIIDGFLKTTIGAEFQLAGRVDRIRKYDTPVRVYIDNRGRPDRSARLKQIVYDIARHIRHIDLATTPKQSDANVVVTMVRERDFYPTLTRLFGRDRMRDIRKNLDPQCLSGFRKDDSYRILGSSVVLITNVSDAIFDDCAYEEMLQALGPINDTDSVPWTMFNDNVQMGYFGVFDQCILNILYDPRVKPGMTAQEVQAVLPQVLPDVRAFVAAGNKPGP